MPAATTSITFTEPDGVNDFVGEGDDFATQVWANPWNFGELYDLARPHHLIGVTAVNGSLSAQIAGNDPHFYLLFPGMPSAINLNTGQQHPIDADRGRRSAKRPRFRFIRAWRNVVRGCDVAIVMADGAYRELDLVELRGLLHPPVLVDGREVFGKDKAWEAGFVYKVIGNS